MYLEDVLFVGGRGRPRVGAGLAEDGEEGGGDFGFDHELQVEQFDD